MKRNSLAMVSMLLLAVAPLAKGQASPNEVPTNLPGTTAFLAPPEGFDPLTAADDELALYGYPPRPGQQEAPREYATWARAIAASRQRLVPVLKVTDHQNTKSAGHLVQDGVFYSTNWSGYADTTSVTSYGTGSFYYIFGDYVVPIAEQAINACTGGWDYSSTWVGIDGYGSGDVLQAGTEADAYCLNYIFGKITSTSYYAWYEWYPNYSVQISSFPISPGDDMFVEVWNTTSTQGYAYLVNENTNQYVSLGFTAPSGTKLVGNSAEWVVEAPTVSGSQTALTNYTQDFFADSYASTFSGLQYGPGSSGNTQFVMTDKSGCTISLPGLLGTNGIWFQDENSARFYGYC